MVRHADSTGNPVHNFTSPYSIAARWLIAALFLVAGVRKAMNLQGTIGHFDTLGLPLPAVVAVLVIALEIGGALALIFAWRVKHAALALAAFSVLSAFIGHRFWAVDPAQFNAQLSTFLKNLSIAGGLMFYAQLDMLRSREAGGSTASTAGLLTGK
jgi:putative oxidoreductase